jgi:hypothetical protein
MMIAANNRFKLASQITAGYDSRILLSAAKNIANEVYFYTLLYRDMHAKSNDIAIPPKLLGSLGLNHNLISCRKPVPESFRKIYEQNASPAHTDDWGKIAYGMIDTYPQNRVTVKGNCSEIAKCGKYPYGIHPPIESADQIIKIYQQQLFKLKFVRDQIHTWYNQACELSDEFNMDILDLFHWEHKHGSWQAFGQLEFDIVHETFTPFNHRGLLELMLSTPAKFRCAPNYTLYKKLLKNMWSEVLRQPLNPKPIKFRVAIHLGRMTFLAKLRFANFLRYFGVYEMAKKLYRKALRKKNG